MDEERAVCVCLNPLDVRAVAPAGHLFFGALLILGVVPEVRGDIKLAPFGRAVEFISLPAKSYEPLLQSDSF